MSVSHQPTLRSPPKSCLSLDVQYFPKSKSLFHLETLCSPRLGGGGCQWPLGARGAAAYPPPSKERLAGRVDARGGGAVVTEADSPLASPLHLSPAQISASLFVGSSQPHGHEFLEGRALLCPLLRPWQAPCLSVRLHLCVCIWVWVQTEVDEPNPKDSESPPL